MNNIIIGLNSGLNLTTETNIVIIGDNIVDLNKNQKNVLFIGDNIAIGTHICGIKINLKEVLEQQLKP